ncbi:MAG: ROK family protein [Candidatus Omnitrophica bacterium]|nr:ROK family protein [Candidatus Omnitrophota bacterium]
MSRSVTVGVDFGGTNIKVGCVTPRGRVVRRLVLPTRAHTTPETFLDGVEGAIARLCAALTIRRSQVRGVGVGVAGLVDGSRGVIYRLVNVPGGWEGVALRRLLERRLRCPCAIENDVNAVALGEWRFGAGRGTRHSVYVTLGTGVGGGLVVDGKLVRGIAGTAGEIGHTGVRLNGPRCACGRRGCLEAFVGTAGIVRRARQAIRAGNRPLERLAARHGGRLSPELVSRAARAGDRAAREIWQEVGCYLGAALANVVNLLSPERIVIGGGVAGAWPWFRGRLRATVRELAFAVPARACQIVRAQLGDDAGIIGGAMLVEEGR